MSISYNASTNFGAKDGLPVNDPNKVIYGAEFTTEFNSITAAFGTAAPTASPAFTGTATFEDVTIGGEAVSSDLIEGWNTTKATVDAGAAGWDSTKATVDAGATGWDATKATVDAGASNWDEAYGWGDHALAGYSGSDTTYTAGAGLTLTGTEFTLNSLAISSEQVTALTKFLLGSRWTAELNGLAVDFKYQGSTKMRLTETGNLTVVGNVTAYGSL